VGIIPGGVGADRLLHRRRKNDSGRHFHARSLAGRGNSARRFV
jgi:hypothetical protein